jgi:hypothetical protein
MLPHEAEITFGVRVLSGTSAADPDSGISSLSAHESSSLPNTNMRSNIILTLVVAFLSSLALSAKEERTIDIFAWPLSASKSHTLAKISYSSTNATVKSYSAPKIPSGEDVVRVGFYHSAGSWSGIATAAENFNPGKEKKLLLNVNAAGEIYHVGFKAHDVENIGKKSVKAKDELAVEVVKMARGPTPVLNKPVALNAEGKLDDKEPEKSFLQKCVQLQSILKVVS